MSKHQIIQLMLTAMVIGCAIIRPGAITITCAIGAVLFDYFIVFRD